MNTPIPPLSAVTSRSAKFEAVEPLTDNRKERIVAATLTWSYARSMYYAGQMGRSEYLKHKHALLALVKTREVP